MIGHKLTLETDDRFDRFRAISWWDQERLSRARVLVVGAGALGNELIKNLALFGIGELAIVDLDHVETSNLSRSVLFRESDAGVPKAVAAARAARSIFPGMKTYPFVGDLVHSLGLGLIRWADLVLGGLDNREARLHINRACYAVGTPFIDGAIDVLSGVARLFLPPEGACYECTLSELDFQLLAQRRSCSLLNRELIARGRTPTTPSSAAIIAGIQTQEAMKLLHGLPTLSGQGVVFDGISHDSYRVDYLRNPDCLSHDPVEAIVETGERAATLTAAALLAKAREVLGPRATLELAREQLQAFECQRCGIETPCFAPLDSLTESDARCASCGERRAPRLFHALGDQEPLLERTLGALGIPSWDIVFARVNERRIGFELDGDREQVLQKGVAP